MENHWVEIIKKPLDEARSILEEVFSRWVHFQCKPSGDGWTYRIWHEVSGPISAQQLDDIIAQRSLISAEAQSGPIFEAEVISRLEALPKVWYCGELRLSKLNDSECELTQTRPDWLNHDEKDQQLIVVNEFLDKCHLVDMKADLEAEGGQYGLGITTGELNLALNMIMRDLEGASYTYDLQQGNGYVNHALYTALLGTFNEGSGRPLLEIRVSELPSGGALLDYYDWAKKVEVEGEAYLALVKKSRERLKQYGVFRAEAARTRTDDAAQRDAHAEQVTERLPHPEDRARLETIERMWRDGRSDREIAGRVDLTPAGVKYHRQQHGWIDPKRRKRKPID